MDNATKKSVVEAIEMAFDAAKHKTGNRSLDADTVADIFAIFIEENYSSETAYAISKMVYECVKNEVNNRKENN